MNIDELITALGYNESPSNWIQDADVDLASAHLWRAAKRPIALDLRLSLVPDQIMGGGQSLDLPDHGLRSRNEAEQQISSERAGIDFPRHKVLIEERRQFRTEIESPSDRKVI